MSFEVDESKFELPSQYTHTWILNIFISIFFIFFLNLFMVRMFRMKLFVYIYRFEINQLIVTIAPNAQPKCSWSVTWNETDTGGVGRVYKLSVKHYKLIIHIHYHLSFGWWIYFWFGILVCWICMDYRWNWKIKTLDGTK